MTLEITFEINSELIIFPTLSLWAASDAEIGKV